MCWKHSVELLKTLLCIKLILYFSKISSCQQATWIVTPDALEARTGSSAEFNWTYQENGVGINGIEWRKVNGSRVMLYFDNTTIGYGEYEGRVDKVGNAGLRIFPVVKNDTGMYSCRVTVGLGDSLYDVSPSMGVHDLPVGAQLKADFILLDIHSNETIASSAQIQGGTEVSLRVPVMINDPPSVSVKAEYKYDSDDEYKELKAWHGLTNTICEYNFSVTAGDRKTMDLSIRVQADHPVFDTEVSIKNYTVTAKPVSDNLEWWIILLIVLAVLLFVGGIIAAILYFFCRDKIKQVREDQKDTTNEKNRRPSTARASKVAVETGKMDSARVESEYSAQNLLSPRKLPPPPASSLHSGGGDREGISPQRQILPPIRLITGSPLQQTQPEADNSFTPRPLPLGPTTKKAALPPLANNVVAPEDAHESPRKKKKVPTATLR